VGQERDDAPDDDHDDHDHAELGEVPGLAVLPGTGA
jgi:hypothetical protein